MSKLALTPIPVDEWPPEIRRLWRASREPAGPFDDHAGLAAGWRPATIRGCERGFGIWLAWLAGRGELAADALPAACVTREHIAAFLADYRPGRAPSTVAGTLRDIAYVLRACQPPDGVAWLTKLAHRLVNTAEPARPKLPRMAPVAVIARLGAKLMTEGLARLEQGKRSGAVTYRDGLLFALLIRRPLRRGEVWQLQLGTTFLVEEGVIQVRIESRNTKSGIAPAKLVPTGIVASTATYLDQVRPMLLRSDRPDEGWFWLNRHGGRLGLQDITARITKLSRKHLGKDLSPHLFRDCAVTAIALAAPEKIGISKSVLAHASPATSQTFYNQATSFFAVREARRGIAQPLRRRRRRGRAMTALALQSRLHEDYAWLFGDGVEWSALTPEARRVQETRIAAALLKRRWSLLIQWRRQSLERCRERTRTQRTAICHAPAGRLRATGDGEISIATNLPRVLPVLRDEMAILRAFLSREIDHILFGDE